jgi:wyosine [tRNA(Phe)-imidazoG37] synthetase (radical SAM superfamily)
VDELAGRLHTEPDVITISGSGEPTLHSGIGRVIERIRTLTPIPVAVITNGSLLWMKEVREDLSGANVVIPSLDAGDAETFEAVNRPNPKVGFQMMVDGLARFVREFEGTVRLEVFLLKGVNDTIESIEALAARASEIGPDMVQINTVTRPPADPDARAVDLETLETVADRFDVPVEVISTFAKGGRGRTQGVGQRDVLAMIERRPCTLEDIASGLGCDSGAVEALVKEMTGSGRIVAERVGELDYFKPSPPE